MLLSSVLLAACGGHEYYGRGQLHAVEPGMTGRQLLAVMGEPHAREPRGSGREIWTYEGQLAEGMYGQPVVAYRMHVTLVDGTVVAQTVEDAGGNTR